MKPFKQKHPKRLNTDTKQFKVAQYVLRNKTITSLEAINQFWATRLSANIYNLKEAGWEFNTTTVRHPKEPKSSYAKYEVTKYPSWMAKYI